MNKQIIHDIFNHLITKYNEVKTLPQNIKLDIIQYIAEIMSLLIKKNKQNLHQYDIRNYMNDIMQQLIPYVQTKIQEKNISRFGEINQKQDLTSKYNQLMNERELIKPDNKIINFSYEQPKQQKKNNEIQPINYIPDKQITEQNYNIKTMVPGMAMSNIMSSLDQMAVNSNDMENNIESMGLCINGDVVEDNGTFEERFKRLVNERNNPVEIKKNVIEGFNNDKKKNDNIMIDKTNNNQMMNKKDNIMINKNDDQYEQINNQMINKNDDQYEQINKAKYEIINEIKRLELENEKYEKNNKMKLFIIENLKKLIQNNIEYIYNTSLNFIINKSKFIFEKPIYNIVQLELINFELLNSDDYFLIIDNEKYIIPYSNNVNSIIYNINKLCNNINVSIQNEKINIKCSNEIIIKHTHLLKLFGFDNDLQGCDLYETNKPFLNIDNVIQIFINNINKEKPFSTLFNDTKKINQIMTIDKPINQLDYIEIVFKNIYGNIINISNFNIQLSFKCIHNYTFDNKYDDNFNIETIYNDLINLE